MKVRVFKKEDGGVIYFYPATKYRDNIDKCRFPSETNGLAYIDVEISELKKFESKDSYHEMIYFDGDCNINNLKQDKSWENCLMPTFLLRKKGIARNIKDVEVELEKKKPSTVKLAKLQYKLTKLKKMVPTEQHNTFWVREALDGLDKRVAEGKPDKPIIRNKLEEKLKKFTKK